MKLIYNSVLEIVNKTITGKTANNKALHFCAYLTNETIKCINKDESANTLHSYSRDKFRKVYGGNYKKEFLDTLIEIGVVVKNSKYSNNKTLTKDNKTFCQSYAITDTHQTKAVTVEIKDNKLSSEHVKYIQRMYKKMNRDNILREMLKNLRKIEFPAFENGIDPLYDELKESNTCDKTTNHKWLSYVEPYTRFMSDEIFISRDITGRAHSPYTRLVKRLRGEATINGERLAELDITASIPQALAVWLKRNDFDDNEEMLKFETDLSNDIYTVIINEHMQDVDKEGQSDKDFRSVIKKELLTFINHKNNTGFTQSHVKGDVKFYSVHKYFKLRYPSIYEFVKEYKATATSIDPDNGYKVVGYALMEIEAEVMIDIMVMDCKGLDIPLITLHDALYVPISHVHKIKHQLEFRLKQAGWVGLIGVEY